ncbi:MAG: C1 family peptidase [Saprospiraceae bacterium]
MAIHMDKDSNGGDNSNNNRRREGGGGGGGLGGLTKFIPIVLFFFFKKPKMTLIILAIVAGLYFFTDGSMFGLLEGNNSAESLIENPEGNSRKSLDNLLEGGEYSAGGLLDDAVYDKAQVYEPLVAGYGNSLPNKTSLREYAPRRLNQGRQGSCVGWSSAYAARTILHARATGKRPDDVAFSPSFLYNQIALEGCQGAYIFEAMKNMEQVGSLPKSSFPYNENSCNATPDRTEKGNAQTFRTKGYNRLSLDHDKYKVNMEAVKENLAQGAPVVIGMMVGGSFMNAMRGKDVWNPTRSDYGKRGFGGHAMCVIGYDDNKAGGSFEIMNSWGESWGDRGYCWVKYKDFQEFVREAYGLYPMGSAKEQVKPENFKVAFGLVNNATEQLIPLRKVTGESNVFRTTNPLTAGDRFKVLVTNNMECNIYIFNEEASGESNVLFPYTDKHSPYCGITGTRLFPKDYSMKLDEVGSRDRIAVVITKQDIDYNEIKEYINKSRQTDFVDKVNEVLANVLDENVRFTADKAISFKGSITGEKAVAMIIEVDK